MDIHSATNDPRLYRGWSYRTNADFFAGHRSLTIVLPRLIQEVRNQAIAFGRDPDAIEITSGGARTVAEAQWYASIGVHRIGVAVRAQTVPELRDELRRFGDEVIAPTAAI